MSWNLKGCPYIIYVPISFLLSCGTVYSLQNQMLTQVLLNFEFGYWYHWSTLSNAFSRSKFWAWLLIYQRSTLSKAFPGLRILSVIIDILLINIIKSLSMFHQLYQRPFQVPWHRPHLVLLSTRLSCWAELEARVPAEWGVPNRRWSCEWFRARLRCSVIITW